MVESRSEAFHLASNMKDKPNAQGTLFSASPSQRTPESRQPRGYSPERMRAVRQELSADKVTPMQGEQMAQENAYRTVARSTVPLNDIAKTSAGEPNLTVRVSAPAHEGGFAGVPSGAAAVYKKADSSVSYGRIDVLPKYAHTFVPIHEIGHHVDRAEPYKTPQQQGRAEGFADAYADEHAKKPGYKSRPATTVPRDRSNYGIWTQGMSHGMADAFDERYQQQRRGSLLQEAQFGPGKDLPKEHIPGQNRLLDKQVGGAAWEPDVKAPAKWHYVYPGTED